MPAGTENLYVGQTKTPNYIVTVPDGQPTPPPGPTFAVDVPGICVAQNGPATVTADPTKWAVPVAITGQTVGTCVLSTSLAGVDQGAKGQVTVVVADLGPDSGAWDTSTLS